MNAEKKEFYITVDDDLLKIAEEFMNKYPQMGYESVSEFVSDAMRYFLRTHYFPDRHLCQSDIVQEEPEPQR